MKIFFALLLLLNVSIIHGQQIQGSFQQKKDIGEGTRIIIFDKGNFEEQSVGDLQTKFGHGSYLVKDGKLVMNYKSYPKQDTSTYEISVLKTSPNSNIELEIFDADSIPMLGYYGCRDTKNNIINVVNTNNKGIGNMTIFNNHNVGYFTIDCIGYHRISIPVKNLMNKQIKIKAYLKAQENYFIEPIKENYRVVKLDGKELILSKDGKTYSFEKIDK